MTEYTGQLIGGPDEGNLITSTVPEVMYEVTYRSALDGASAKALVSITRGVYRWDPEIGGFRWRLLGTAHPDEEGPQGKIRPGRITAEQVQAYHDAWHRTAPGAPGDRTRTGLAAAYVQWEREVREDRAASGQHMDREARIRERTRDLLDEIVSVELSHDLDPYPASVPEVADEIARYVLELEDSGAARGLASMVRTCLRTGMDSRGQEFMERTREAGPVCRQGDHRDGRDAATARIRYRHQARLGNELRWTTDMCDRHAQIAADNMTRAGWREVEIMPAGWTPEQESGA